ncbi:Beta/gamma crystallin domain-containing protein 1 [Takifugu flavidus]|uniref:Beta/gamma crystallin domain-containing protein 1 n=1 Tax=Takifugu flavidus TaxID=433684 RepID=A0A5C6NM63_9TELE|nr:Beta/gamma crystallin domain-containing protein 1 [Takifugu flavidus]
MPGEGAIVPPGQPRNAEGQKGDIIATPPKGVGSMEPQPADSNLTGNSTAVELSPVARGDISQQPQPFAGKAEVSQGKPRQTPNLAASPQANKLIPGSAQPSPKKKLSFSWGKSQEDSDRQDAPSSWLDVDLPKQRLRVAAPKLNSSGSESNLLDTSGEFDDDDFVEKIKKLCAPFSLPPRKHNPLGPPQPPFALPAIKEDRYEKTFDPEEFKFGLRKPKYTLEAATSTLNKLHNMESKSGLKPFRASLSDRSFLLSSLDTQSRLKTPIKDEEEATEEKEEKVKMKSRLEGSCVLSSLTSSLMKGKKNGVQPQAEGTNSGEVSPSNAPQPRSPPLSQPPPPSPTSDQQSPALSQREEVPALLNDTGPPLPSFTDIKLPEYLEKYLPQEAPKPAPDVREQEQLNKVLGNMPTQPPAAGTEAPVRTSPGIHPAEPPSFPGKATLDLKDPAAGQPQHTLTQSKRTARGFHKRPGKIVLFERAQFSGQAYEIYRDMADATCLQLSALISVKVVRGCWMLYEKPDFQGRTIALEEGGIELDNVWAESGAGTEPQDASPMLIGSIRLAVWDYSIPCMDLFTEPEGRGRITSYHDDTIETGTFGIPLSTASIQVYSGVWLVFSDPGFQGMLAVLEKGEYPFPESWGFSSPFVGSLRPLKMGGFKVENASEIKAVVYEKPGFQGSCMEVDGNIFSFPESNDADPKKPKSAGSLKIIGGLWVGYSEPRFEGQQHILEEGEYWDGSDWGGSEGLKSLQPVLSQDFFSPHLKMFRDRDFGGMDIDITVPVPNMEETGYGTKTQSLDVIGGVWVVFEEPGFCGESYVIERGLYGCPEDWGALQPRIASAMPVVLSDFKTTAKFKVHLFSEPGFQGSSVVLEDSVASLQDGFCVASCKVWSGSWLAFEGADFSSRLYVLEEGSYPDLKSMGCVHGASIQSLQTVGFVGAFEYSLHEFSLPSLTLFERCGLRGKRVVLTEGSVNLPLTGGCSRVQSVLVEGGIWVVHEGINYRGAQIVLRPGEVHDWYKFSSWLKIGSLRPLPQKQVHFRLRNRHSGLVMALAGDLDDIKMMRIQEMEENGELEQIWFYQNGSLHSKLLEEFCLGPSGSMVMAGSRVGLAPELDAQAHLWSLTSEGFLRYTPTHNLVLDIKGGHHYDKNLVILNTLDPSRQQQLWDVDVL